MCNTKEEEKSSFFLLRLTEFRESKLKLSLSNREEDKRVDRRTRTTTIYSLLDNNEEIMFVHISIL